eukprot:c8054_g1_i1.p1 GENE.c8054_g1_i1~~c8054_g1_i1.p1  ORF type:complete len:128 (-),score=16.81 c8054_g1_i1:18-401(-)
MGRIMRPGVLLVVLCWGLVQGLSLVAEKPEMAVQLQDEDTASSTTLSSKDFHFQLLQQGPAERCEEGKTKTEKFVPSAPSTLRFSTGDFPIEISLTELNIRITPLECVEGASDRLAECTEPTAHGCI